MPQTFLKSPSKHLKNKKNTLFLKKVAKKFGDYIKTPYLCTRFRTQSLSIQRQWRDGRVVDYNGLENRRAERHRGFESLSLRHLQRCESHLWFASFVFIKRIFLYINY